MTDDEIEGMKIKKKKKVIGKNGEIMYVTDSDEDKRDIKKKQKRMIGKNGEVFYITDSEGENEGKKKSKNKQQSIKRTEEEEDEIFRNA